jgi:hypothetical protein
MATETYGEYTIRGFAKPMGDGSFEASGAVEKGTQVLETSDPIGFYPSFQRAVAEGLVWARAWVDAHV